MRDKDASVRVREDGTASGTKAGITYIRSDERKILKLSIEPPALQAAGSNIANDSPQSSETFVVTVLYHPLLDYSALHYSSRDETVNLEMRAPRGALISSFFPWKICGMMDSVGVSEMCRSYVLHFLHWILCDVTCVTTGYLQCGYVNVGSKYVSPCRHQI